MRQPRATRPAGRPERIQGRRSSTSGTRVISTIALPACHATGRAAGQVKSSTLANTSGVPTVPGAARRNGGTAMEDRGRQGRGRRLGAADGSRHVEEGKGRVAGRASATTRRRSRGAATRCGGRRARTPNATAGEAPRSSTHTGRKAARTAEPATPHQRSGTGAKEPTPPNRGSGTSEAPWRGPGEPRCGGSGNSPPGARAGRNPGRNAQDHEAGKRGDDRGDKPT